MKYFLFSISTLCMILVLSSNVYMQRRGSSLGSSYGKSSRNYFPKNSSSSTSRKLTYEVGGTKYFISENYKSSGLPKVSRSSSAKHEFLKSQGYDKTPSGFDVDHVTPLSKGGTDKPYNMQLLPREIHKQKTASERRSK